MIINYKGGPVSYKHNFNNNMYGDAIPCEVIMALYAKDRAITTQEYDSLVKEQLSFFTGGGTPAGVKNRV